MCICVFGSCASIYIPCRYKSIFIEDKCASKRHFDMKCYWITYLVCEMIFEFESKLKRKTNYSFKWPLSVFNKTLNHKGDLLIRPFHSISLKLNSPKSMGFSLYYLFLNNTNWILWMEWTNNFREKNESNFEIILFCSNLSKYFERWSKVKA